MTPNAKQLFSLAIFINSILSPVMWTRTESPLPFTCISIFVLFKICHSLHVMTKEQIDVELTKLFYELRILKNLLRFNNVFQGNTFRDSRKSSWCQRKYGKGQTRTLDLFQICEENLSQYSESTSWLVCVIFHKNWNLLCQSCSKNSK